ncbi:MAG: hypothetical protein GY761_07925 [Hyphomicrobiales bacterium]|nr:hypothetical protein [Hyphomicrobiales bacterium]
MPFYYDHTCLNKVEVMIEYRIIGGGGGSYFEPDEPMEVEFGDVTGLPEGQKLTQDDWDTIEKTILENPPEDDDYFDFFDD